MSTVTEKKSSRSAFGQKLKAARLAAGLSQAKLGERLGVVREVIAKLETHPDANPTWETVLALADILGVTPNHFTEIKSEQAAPAVAAQRVDPGYRSVGKRK